MANVSVNSTPLLRFSQAGSGITAGASVDILRSFKAVYNVGTLLDQCDTVHAKNYAFAAASQTVDLHGGTLFDLYGNPAVFARVNLLAFKIYDTTDGHALTIGDDASGSEWSGAAALLSTAGTLRILASTAANDGFLVLAAPNSTGYVVDNTHKLLKMDPGAATFNADVIFIGRSA